MDKRSILFIACVSLAFFGIQYWSDRQSGAKASQTHTEAVSEKIENINKQSQIAGNLPQLAKSDESLDKPLGEDLYVLENQYQQLVFSTLGGSLAEINLPFRTSKESKSYVKEIESDRAILKDSPVNANFPSQPAYFAGKNLSAGSKGGYYPLLRRTIFNSDGSVRHTLSSQYYALNIVNDDPQTSQIQYRVKRFEKDLIEFEASQSGRTITKTYTIPEERNGPYCFELVVNVDGDARGLWISSGIPEVELMSGSFNPLLRYQVMHDHDSDVETINLSDKNPMTVITSVSPHWISNSNGYLGIIIDPVSEIGQGFKALKIPGNDVPTRLSMIDPTYQPYQANKFAGYSTYLPLKSGSQTFRIFAGPFDDTLLNELDELYDDPISGYNPEFSNAQSIQGWFSFISQPFAQFLYLLLRFFYFISHSWGFSIILLTIALRLMMYPLNNWSLKSTIRMQEISPKVKAIQDRYKKDPKKAQLEVMNLYREQGINPFSGCLPMLLQMPFLIGMFYLLKSTFQLRGASFIPGWIENLAAPDILFSWNYPIFLIGNEFHLLPILLGATMYWQQKMTSKLPKDTRDLSESQKQQKMMGNIMSIVFTVMFYSFPSGLNIYFISSTLLGILQQWYLTKKMKETPIILKK